MKPVRIFRHIECEGPAFFQSILESKNIAFELIKVDKQQAIKTDLDDTSGLLFMGGSMSVNDPLDWISQEISLIQNAMQQNIPVMGICLGSQLMAKAMGAKINPGPCMELGWGPVRCQKDTSQNSISWLQALPDELMVFHWHGETFDIPEGATRIFANDRYQNQGFVSGPHIGLQFHLEMQTPVINEWLDSNPADLDLRCDRNNNAQNIRQQTEQHIRALQDYAAIIFNHWLDNCSF